MAIPILKLYWNHLVLTTFDTSAFFYVLADKVSLALSAKRNQKYQNGNIHES
jgi:hypothetical protein